jgi:hypothetical protein
MAAVTTSNVKAEQGKGDLVSGLSDGLHWEPGKQEDALKQLVAQALNLAQDAIAWYLRARRPKRFFATGLRLLAILAAAAAGIIPMLTDLTFRGRSIPAVWASILLAVAAACVALDRFFGYSSAWIRFITAELKIRQQLHEFQFDWEALRASWQGGAPTPEQVQDALQRCRVFLSFVDAVIREETAIWVQEFQETIRTLDEAVKTTATSLTLGAIAVEVTNGDQCEAGWELFIDSGAPHLSRGKTAALTGVLPGIRAIKVQGKIAGGKLLRAETPVSVPAGGMVQVSLTLG